MRTYTCQEEEGTAVARQLDKGPLVIFKEMTKPVMPKHDLFLTPMMRPVQHVSS